MRIYFKPEAGTAHLPALSCAYIESRRQGERRQKTPPSTEQSTVAEDKRIYIVKSEQQKEEGMERRRVAEQREESIKYRLKEDAKRNLVSGLRSSHFDSRRTWAWRTPVSPYQPMSWRSSNPSRIICVCACRMNCLGFHWWYQLDVCKIFSAEHYFWRANIKLNMEGRKETFLVAWKSHSTLIAARCVQYRLPVMLLYCGAGAVESSSVAPKPGSAVQLREQFTKQDTLCEAGLCVVRCARVGVRSPRAVTTAGNQNVELITSIVPTVDQGSPNFFISRPRREIWCLGIIMHPRPFFGCQPQVLETLLQALDLLFSLISF